MCSARLRGWKLLWRDEFKSRRLDSRKWSFQQGNGCELGLCGWGNGELQYYTNRSANVDVEDGRLIIKARHETGPARERLQNFCRFRCRGDSECRRQCGDVAFSSSRIRTAGKFSVGPGSKGFSKIRISARVKVTPGAGLWPAIWLLPESPRASRCSGCGRYGGWASSGEIDVFEAANDMRTAMGSIHYGAPWPNNNHVTHSTELDPNRWHTMTLLWSKRQMEWFMDGRKYGESRASGGARGADGGWFTTAEGARETAPFDTNFHLIINLAVGGGFTGGMPAEAAAGALAGGAKTMHVDWIRVYGQK